MSSVDHRIVEMEFDNKQFEKNVSTTINSIDELKKKLQFDGVNKGFDQISKGFDGISTSKLGAAIDSVTSKFSFLGTIGDQAIRTITNSITNKLLYALKEASNMITGMGYSMEGFKEYELKIGSIQTIAANTGALSNLNKATKEAIEYSEEELELANKVVQGYYSTGIQRKEMIEALGYDYEKIQNKVNNIVAGIDDEISESGENAKTTLADIDAALDELNVYADKTIYNFSQMTQAVGRFTTAGIDLETSTQTVEAISNLAALSGASNANLQSAMYNFSQAMQKGTMQLIDWRSIENANMASAQFKEAIMETARVHGIAIDQMIEKNGSFNETLSSGWLTNDIMIESLAKLTAFTEDMTEEEREAERATWREIGYTEEQIAAIEDLSRVAYESATKVRTFSQLIDTTKEEIGSSYTMMWQNIIGGFDEATDLWTNVHNAIQDHFITPMTQARDAKWSFFHDNGGREAAIEGLTNVAKGLYKIIKAITDAWKEVFPPDDGRRITAMAKAFAEFSKKLIVSDETAEKIKMTFKGLFSILHIFVSLAKIGIKVIGTLIKTLMNLSSGSHPILDLTSKLGGLLVELDHFISDTDTIETAVNTIIDLLRRLWNVMEPIADHMAEIFSSQVSPKIQKVFTDLRGYIRSFVKGSSDDVNSIENEDTSGVQTFGDKIKNAIGPALEKLEPVINFVKKIAKIYFEIVKKVIFWSKDVLLNIKELIFEAGDNLSLTDLFEAIIGAEMFMMFRSIKKFFDDAQKSLGNINKTLNGINGILGGVKDVLQAYVLDIQANVILKIAIAVLMLCGSLIALSQIDADALFNALKAMSALMAELLVITLVMAKLSPSLSTGLISNAGTILLGIASAILVITSAVAILGFMDEKHIAKGLTAMIYILIITIGAVFALSKAMKLITPKEIMGAAFSLMMMAAAINMMVIPLLILSVIPTEIITNGIYNLIMLMVVMSAFVAAIALASKLVNSAGSIISAAFSLILMATAINMLVVPLLIFSLIPTEKIKQGVLVLGVILLALSYSFGVIAGLMIVVPAKSILAAGLALMEIAFAIQMLTIPLLTLGLIPTDIIKKGMFSIAVALAGLIVALWAMPKDKDEIAKALSAIALDIIVIAGALLLLAPIKWTQLLAASVCLSIVLMSFAALMSQIKPSKNIPKSLAAIALTIAVIAGSLFALSKLPLEDLMIAVGAISGLIIVIMVAAAVAGKFKAVGEGLIKLGNAFLSLSAAVLNVGLGIALLSAALWLLSEINYDNIKLDVLGKQIAAFITELLIGLLEGIERLMAAVLTVVPAFVSYLLQALVIALNKIAENIEPFINALVLIFVRICNGVETHALTIVDSLLRAIIAVFNAVSTWLSDEENFKDLTKSITNLVAVIFAVLLELVHQFFEIGVLIIKEVLNGILSWYEGTAIYDYLSNIGEDLYDIFHDIVEKINWAEIGLDIINMIVSGMNPASLIGNKIFGKIRKYAKNLSSSKEETKSIYEQYYGKYKQEFRKSEYPDQIGSTYAGIEEAFEAWYNANIANANEKAPEFEKTFKELGDICSKAFNKGLGVASPSYKAAEGVDYFAEGALNSVEDNKSSLLDSIENLGNSMSEKFGSSLSFDSFKDKLNFSDIASDSIDTGEVINMDELNKSFNTDDYSKNLSGTVSFDNTDFTNSMTMDVSDQMDKNQKDILSRTNDIYNELSSLRSYISEIKIQLDSGALVGSLVGPMDAALGERSSMKGRGV